MAHQSAIRLHRLRAVRQEHHVISILIPVKDGGSELQRCLEAISRQETDQDEEVEVIIVDSGSTDGSPDRARSFGAQVYEIPPHEFDHGATRNLAARLSRGDVLVLTSQDAAAAGDGWLKTLVAALDREDVAGVYGRQLPHEGATPPECFFLDFMYGPNPRVQRLADEETLTYEQTLFSNANSAMKRSSLGSEPVRGEHRDERRPGMVAAAPARRSHDRVRTWRSRSPLTRLYTRRRVSTLLRLGHLGSPKLRRRWRVTPSAGASGAKLRRGGAQLALADRTAPLDPFRRDLRARKGRGLAGWASSRGPYG